MHIFGRFSISLIVMLITRSSESKDIGLSDTAQGLNFDGSLDKVNRLPVVVTWGLLELVDELLL